MLSKEMRLTEAIYPFSDFLIKKEFSSATVDNHVSIIRTCLRLGLYGDDLFLGDINNENVFNITSAVSEYAKKNVRHTGIRSKYFLYNARFLEFLSEESGLFSYKKESDRSSHNIRSITTRGPARAKHTIRSRIFVGEDEVAVIGEEDHPFPLTMGANEVIAVWKSYNDTLKSMPEMTYVIMRKALRFYSSVSLDNQTLKDILSINQPKFYQSISSKILLDANTLSVLIRFFLFIEWMRPDKFKVDISSLPMRKRPPKNVYLSMPHPIIERKKNQAEELIAPSILQEVPLNTILGVTEKALDPIAIGQSNATEFKDFVQAVTLAINRLTDIQQLLLEHHIEACKQHVKS